MILISSGFVRAPLLSIARDTGGDQDAIAQPDPGVLWRQVAATVSAVEPLQGAGHSDPGAGADSSGDFHISPAPLGMNSVRLFRQNKEPLHTLEGQISGLMVVLSPSHGQTCRDRSINLFRPDLS